MPLPRTLYFQMIINHPERNVNIAPQRNQNKARGMSCGTTSLRVAAWSALVTCALTRLKKSNMPIQIIPATRWIQRSRACKTSFESTTIKTSSQALLSYSDNRHKCPQYDYTHLRVPPSRFPLPVKSVRCAPLALPNIGSLAVPPSSAVVLPVSAHTAGRAHESLNFGQ
jgi:hypothetical protein